MTLKLTLFLVCAFEIGLILFVAAWTARADWPKEIMDIQLGQPCSKNITKENNQTNARAICTRYGKQKIKAIFVCFKTTSFDALKSKIEKDFDTTNWESSGSFGYSRTWKIPDPNSRAFIGNIKLTTLSDPNCPLSLSLRDYKVFREERKSKIDAELSENKSVLDTLK